MDYKKELTELQLEQAEEIKILYKQLNSDLLRLRDSLQDELYIGLTSRWGVTQLKELIDKLMDAAVGAQVLKETIEENNRLELERLTAEQLRQQLQEDAKDNEQEEN